MKLKKMLVQLGYYSKPSFMIIGAQKAGTTALHDILVQHPQIIPAKDKELHYFDGARIAYPNPVAYHNNFPLPHKLWPNRYTFEASPSYLHNALCPQRLFDYKKDLKLIVILRNPVQRAYSAWTMYHGFQNNSRARYRNAAEYRSFTEVIHYELNKIKQGEVAKEGKAYVDRGIYFTQLQRYFSLFPRSQFFITEQEQLKNDFPLVMQSLCQFLAIDSEFIFESNPANVGSYENKEKPDAVLQELENFYQPYNEQLFDLLGTRYNW